MSEIGDVHKRNTDPFLSDEETIFSSDLDWDQKRRLRQKLNLTRSVLLVAGRPEEAGDIERVRRKLAGSN